MFYGPARLLQLYLGGTALGGMLQLPRGGTFTQIMGASAGVASILTFWILNNPYQTIYVYFFPVPAWVVGIVFMGYSYLYMDSMSTTGHAGHFGGGVFGGLIYFLLKRRMIR